MSKALQNTGKTVIQLSKPLSIAGAEVAYLEMREPTVADQLAMDRSGGGDAEKELGLIANLCQVAPSDLHQLTLRDYKKVQKALTDFLA